MFIHINEVHYKTEKENGQLKQKVETLEKEKFLLMEQLSATEAKLKAAQEKAEEKVKDKEEPAKVAEEAAEDDDDNNNDDDDEAGKKKVRGEIQYRVRQVLVTSVGLT